jgi:hypothetical protein
MTAETAPPQTRESLLAQLKELGLRLFREANYDDARLVFKKLIELDKKDIISRFIYAQLIDDGTHKKVCRISRFATLDIGRPSRRF